MNKQIIKGTWVKKDDKIIEDSNCALIKEKLANDLIKVAVSTDGWDILYKEKDLDVYWELVYPQSELPGGGPAQLESFSFNEVKDKYNLQTGD